MHRSCLCLFVCLCPCWQILVIIGLTHVLVIFRVIAAVLLANGSWEFLSNHSNTGAMMLGAVLHYLIITVMTRVGRPVPSQSLNILCGADAVLVFAGQQDRCHEALRDWYVDLPRSITMA